MPLHPIWKHRKKHFFRVTRAESSERMQCDEECLFLKFRYQIDLSAKFSEWLRPPNRKMPTLILLHSHKTTTYRKVEKTRHNRIK